MWSLALISLEGEDVDRHTVLLVDGSDILVGVREGDVVESNLREVVDVVSSSVWMLLCE